MCAGPTLRVSKYENMLGSSSRSQQILRPYPAMAQQLAEVTMCSSTDSVLHLCADPARLSSLTSWCGEDAHDEQRRDARLCTQRGSTQAGEQRHQADSSTASVGAAPPLTWIASRIHVRWKVDANHQRQKRCRQGCGAPLAAAPTAAGAAIAAGAAARGYTPSCSVILQAEAPKDDSTRASVQLPGGWHASALGTRANAVHELSDEFHRVIWACMLRLGFT